MSEVAALPQHSAERLRLSEKTQITSRERICLDLSERRRSPLISRVSSAGKAKPYRTALRQSCIAFARSLLAFMLLFCSACSQGIRRSGIPAEAQSVLDTSLEDIDAERYENLYREAADEWRNDATLDESKATFQRLREKLGNVRTRNFHSAHEEQTSTAPIAGHSVVVIYQTSFERGDGMETLTLLERGGHWYLARYYVASIALK